MTRLLTFALLLLLVFSGQPLAADKVIIQLKWFHQFQFAGYYAAIDQGYYADEGLEVELRERDPARDPVDDVLDGRADYGVTDTRLVLAVLQGKPLALVAQIFQHSPLVLMTRREDSIKNVFDLRGKRVTASIDGITDPSLLAMLVDSLGSIEQVDIQPYTFRYDDLIEGQTDALAGYITDQPFYFREKGLAVDIIDPRDYGIDFYGDNLFTTLNEARQNPQRVAKIRRATLKGWSYALQHRDEIIDLILQRYNTQGSSRERLRVEATEIGKLILADFIAPGSYQRSRFDKIAQTYSQLGFAQNVQMPDSFYLGTGRSRTNLTNAEKEYLRRLPALRVPLIDKQPPLSFAANGEPSGYLNDLLKLIAQQLEVEIDFLSGLSYAQSLQALQQDQVDLLSDYSAFGQQRNYLRQTRSVLTTPFVAVGPANAPPVFRMDDLSDKRLVLVRGFQQTLTIQNSYPSFDVQLVDSIDRAYQKLRAGEADYYIDNEPHASYNLQNRLFSDFEIAGELPPAIFGQLDLRFAVDNDKPLLHSAMEKALRSIDLQKLQSLRQRWLSGDPQTQSIQFTETELQWLLDNPTIRVVVDPNWAPIEYRSEQGAYQGISIDYLHLLEQTLNVRFEIMAGLSWSEGIDAIRNKQADMFSSVARTPQRQTFSLFTEPYVSMPIRIFATGDQSYIGSLDNLAGRLVAVARDYAIHDWLEADFPQINLVAADNPADGLQQLSDGKVDAFVGNAITANYYMNKLKLDNVQTAGDTPYSNNQSMAVRDDWPVLAGILDKALASIPQHKHNAIFNRWMSIRFEQQIDYRLLWWIVVVSALLLATVVYWNRSLDRQVRLRTRRIEENERQHRTLIETTSEGFWMVDRAGDTLDVNLSLCKMLGRTRDEIIGVNISRYIDADYQIVYQQFSSLIESNEHQSYEIVLTRRNGSQVPVIFESTTLRDRRDKIAGVFIFVTNITNQKALEHRLRKSEESFRTLFESSPLPMLIIDDSPASNIRFMNRKFSDLFGYTPEQVWDVHSWWSNAYPDEQYRSRVQKWWQSAVDEMNHSAEHTFSPINAEVTCANGDKRWVEASMALLSGLGLVVFHDITERKQREMISELHRQLSDLVYQGEQDQLMRLALDTAEQITHSNTGFYCQLNLEQQTIASRVWSSRTLRNLPPTDGDGLPHPEHDTSMWQECIRQRHPVIQNTLTNQDDAADKTLEPKLMRRKLVFPVLRDDQVVAVIGVGNKQIDYDRDDVSLVRQIADLAQDFIERRHNKQQIEFMAYNDVLTGLPNRELLADRLGQAMSLCSRNKQLLAVCYLDLDGFKPVNDNYGHHIGDQLLVELAQRLSEDLRDGDTLARLGGDEFIILLGSLENIYDGEEIISRILTTINQPFVIGQHRILVSGSMGVTFYPPDKSDADTLIRHADQAMYRAKANGSSTFHLYDTVQDQKLHAHRRNIEEFARAINEDQLLLNFQPKVDLGNGNVTGFEALVRWQHPHKGLLAPGVFLEMIEGSPEEIALGEWVLKSALDQHMAWRDQLGKKFQISVNISPRHIQMSDFIDRLQGLLEDYPADIAHFLELEVLENTAIGDTGEVAQIMARCSELGIRFSLDDFGTGYSSLTYFHRLPIDILKIDQNFVRHMLDNARDVDIVEGVLRLAEALDRPVIAEGVESETVGMILLQLGCRYAQGYGIARPMTADKVPAWLDQWQAENLWQQLPEQTGGASDLYDLNVSIFSHVQWLQGVIDAIRSNDPQQLAKVADNPCHLGRWYKGIGRVRYGNHPRFDLLPPQHRKLHELAQKLSHDSFQTNREIDPAEIKTLQRESEILVALLRDLAGSHTRH